MRCSRCGGLLVPEDDMLKCLNCGSRIISEIEPPLVVDTNRPWRPGTCKLCHANARGRELYCRPCKGLLIKAGMSEKMSRR